MKFTTYILHDGRAYNIHIHARALQNIIRRPYYYYYYYYYAQTELLMFCLRRAQTVNEITGSERSAARRTLCARRDSDAVPPPCARLAAHRALAALNFESIARPQVRFTPPPSDRQRSPRHDDGRVGSSAAAISRARFYASVTVL